VYDWTYQEVGDWLKHLGLNDYIEKFKENHIDGKVLFEITEADLKDEFNMTSVGHRKNFLKAVENLKRIYNDRDGKNSDYIRDKIQKFYERNQQTKSKSLLAGLTKERNFYSHRFSTRNMYSSQHEVIEEDDEFNMKHDSFPSPILGPKKHLLDQRESKDEMKLEYMNRNGSPTKRRECHDDADDELHDNRSLEELDEIKPVEPLAKNNQNKKTLSKISSDSQKSSPEKGHEALKDQLEMQEETKKISSPNSRKIEKESSNSQGTSSDTSTESDPSDDEKIKKYNEDKLKEEPIPVKNALKIVRAYSKFEKKGSKKSVPEKSFNFKSAELPVVSRTTSKKYGKEAKRTKNTTGRGKDTLNEKISKSHNLSKFQMN